MDTGLTGLDPFLIFQKNLVHVPDIAPQPDSKHFQEYQAACRRPRDSGTESSPGLTPIQTKNAEDCFVISLAYKDVMSEEGTSGHLSKNLRQLVEYMFSILSPMF